MLGSRICVFFFQAEDGIRDVAVTGVQTCALPISKAVRGVRQVVQIPSGVAVLADGYWAAKLGRDALEIQWDHGANAALSSEGISKMLSDGALAGGAVGRNEGSDPPIRGGCRESRRRHDARRSLAA